MKFGFFVFLLVLQMSFAQAMPDMGESVGVRGGQLATVVPDDVDKNHFYIFPQMGSILVNSKGQQQFRYVETRLYRRKSYSIQDALLSLGLKIGFDNPDLSSKIEQIKATNPKATFSTVTFVASEVTVDQTIEGKYLESSCSQIAGPAEVPVYCTLKVNPILATSFRQLIQNGPIRVLQYTYQFYGKGKGQTNLYTFTVPLVLGAFADPSLFVDQYGDPI